MDETTLLLFAGKLLDACDLHKGNSVFSIIAEFDRKPAHFHRIFSSVLANHSLIIEVATDILGNEEVKTRDFEKLREKYRSRIDGLEKEQEKQKKLGLLEEFRNTKNKLYCYKRMLEDLGYFFKSLDEIEPFVGREILEIRADKLAAHLALLSHVYLISYTFPPQPFFPYASNACQHIDFCKKVDYFDFKQMFSGEDNERIYEFRKAMAENEKAWSREVDPNLEEDPLIRKRMEESFGEPFNPYGMIKAMIERLGALAPGISYEAVQRTIRDYMFQLGCKDIIHSDRERWFLMNLEKEIENSIISAL
jgi:hypothetical protein